MIIQPLRHPRHHSPGLVYRQANAVSVFAVAIVAKGADLLLPPFQIALRSVSITSISFRAFCTDPDPHLFSFEVVVVFLATIIVNQTLSGECPDNEFLLSTDG